MASNDWEAVIGLEVHAQLLTNSKVFSEDLTKFGGADNEHVSPVSLGMPGALPVLNKRAVEFSARTGLALAALKHSLPGDASLFGPADLDAMLQGTLDVRR